RSHPGTPLFPYTTLFRSQAPAALAAVQAVATCTFWHSVIGADAGGRAITPLLLWADARSHRQAQALREVLDERAVHARTGCVLRSEEHTSELQSLAYLVC